MRSVAVVGAGLAGAAAAAALTHAGASVRVFDKGRGPGGRLATRRVRTPLGEAHFDHGAQYVTAESDAFAAALARMEAHGEAARWRARLLLQAGEERRAMPDKDRFVGAPGMNALVKAALAGIDARWGVEVAAIRPEGAGLALLDADGVRLAAADRVIVAVPAEQAAPLLMPIAPNLAEEASSVRAAPCWTAMLVFEQPLDPGFDALAESDGPLAWIARNSAKPGRIGPESWVVQAGPGWSQARLEEPAQTIAAALAEAAAAALAATPVFALAHRWRYARAASASLAWFGLSADGRIGVCGDWRRGARAEFAFLSGEALGRAMA